MIGRRMMRMIEMSLYLIGYFAYIAYTIAIIYSICRKSREKEVKTRVVRS